MRNSRTARIAGAFRDVLVLTFQPSTWWRTLNTDDIRSLWFRLPAIQLVVFAYGGAFAGVARYILVRHGGAHLPDEQAMALGERLEAHMNLLVLVQFPALERGGMLALVLGVLLALSALFVRPPKARLHAALIACALAGIATAGMLSVYYGMTSALVLTDSARGQLALMLGVPAGLYTGFLTVGVFRTHPGRTGCVFVILVPSLISAYAGMEEPEQIPFLLVTLVVTLRLFYLPLFFLLRAPALRGPAFALHPALWDHMCVPPPFDLVGPLKDLCREQPDFGRHLLVLLNSSSLGLANQAYEAYQELVAEGVIRPASAIGSAEAD